jgi:hypothetical protein
MDSVREGEMDSVREGEMDSVRDRVVQTGTTSAIDRSDRDSRGQ